MESSLAIAGTYARTGSNAEIKKTVEKKVVRLMLNSLTPKSNYLAGGALQRK